MVSTIFEIVLVILAHATVGIFSSTLRYGKRTTCIVWGVWAAIQIGLLIFAELAFNGTVMQFFISFILSLIGQYVIFFIMTTGRLAQRVFTIMTYSIFFCISMALFTLVKGSFPDLNEAIACFINAIILIGVVFYFLKYVCALCKTASKSITTGWAPLIFVNVVFLLTVILSSVFPQRLTSFKEPTFITFVFLSVSIMAVYPLIFSNINNMSDAAMKREVETQNQLLLAQIEVENALLTADSQARHDRRHHNLVMLEFANNNDIESIKDYLKNLVNGEREIWGEVRYCDNMTVNTVLTVYERRARENGITVNVAALASHDLEILSKDLVVVVANLFENAINAASKLKNKDKFINITIKESAQRLLINIENSCKEKLIFDSTIWGIGIQSVIATAEKYDGMYDFSAEGGIFSARVSLNLK